MENQGTTLVIDCKLVRFYIFTFSRRENESLHSSKSDEIENHWNARWPSQPAAQGGSGDIISQFYYRTDLLPRGMAPWYHRQRLASNPSEPVANPKKSFESSSAEPEKKGFWSRKHALSSISTSCTMFNTVSWPMALYLFGNLEQKSKPHYKQARKPRSYASPKLCRLNYSQG